jgi:hexosaminidase
MHGFLLIAAAAAAGIAPPTQADLDRLAGDMGVRLEILDNHPAKCPGQADGCFLSELRLRMPETLPPGLEAGDFKLYFSSVSPIISVDSGQFDWHAINGDLNFLQPRSRAQLRGGEIYRVRIWSQGHFFSAYYPMPNMFLVSGGLAPRTVAGTRPVIDPESGLERLPFVSPMTDEAKLATASPDDETRWMTPERTFAEFARRGAAAQSEIVILPTPLRVTRPAGPALDLTGGNRLRLTGIERSGLDPALQQLRKVGVKGLTRGPELRVAIARGLPAEGYRLTAGRGGVRIVAADPAGAAHALRSLAQQVAYEGGRLRPLQIEDSPRLDFRGLHVDVARNFHSKAELLKLVEQMAVYKLNKLHLHLGDDEGWRLEIKALPELTQVSAAMTRRRRGACCRSWAPARAATRRSTATSARPTIRRSSRRPRRAISKSSRRSTCPAIRAPRSARWKCATAG